MSLTLGDKTILKNINFQAERGERIILIGINGSGKTCLLRTMSGMHMIKKGNIVIDKKTCFQDQCNGIAFLGESWTRTVAFAGHSIAYQADIMVKDMMKKVQEDNLDRKNELTNVLGINPNWKMHLVSSGQRRRVRLFLGLLKPFKLALIDEMTMDLDIVTRIRFMEWLKKESIENQATIIYATHIFDGLDDWPTHIAHINCKGEIGETCMISTTNIGIMAYNLLMKDYDDLEKNKISEKEDGEGMTELERSKNILNGKQGGYASGRVGNATSN